MDLGMTWICCMDGEGGRVSWAVASFPIAVPYDIVLWPHEPIRK